MSAPVLRGLRFALAQGDEGFPSVLAQIARPPEMLYGVGDVAALQEGLAVIGARKATPYGLSCARRFARIAAERGIVIVSGGARGCDSAAHLAALEAGGRTVVFLGGGCDRLYPSEHADLFQRIIDSGGAVVSEHSWESPPRPYAFRARNRLIAGLARAVLIVEAGLPSGTFSTADEALAAGKDVLAVPGAVSSSSSRGANRLIFDGACPIVDDETFEDRLALLFDDLRRLGVAAVPLVPWAQDEVVAAAQAEPLTMESLFLLARRMYGGSDAQVRSQLMSTLAEAEATGALARGPDGRFGPCVGF